MTVASTMVHWTIREPPLTPVAVTVPADRAAALVDAVRRRVDGGARLSAVAGAEWLVVFGEPEDLPWSPGVRYLGRDGGLLLPTELVPSVPVDLLRLAAAAEAAAGGPLLAILPGVLIFADLPRRPVDVEALRARFGPVRDEF